MKTGLVLLLSIGISTASAQDTLRSSVFKSAWIPTLQSAAAPGWGQLSRGEWLRGSLFLAGEAFLAWDAVHFWENQYNRPGWDKSGRVYDRDTAYGLAGWYALGALFSAADAYYGAAQTRESSSTLAVLRSLAFPGCGQLANGKRWKAAGVFLLQTSLAYAAYTQHQRFLFYDGQGQDQEARFFKNDRNRLLWWSVGAMIYSAADAYVDCQLQKWDVSPDLTLAPVYFPEQKAWGVALQLPVVSPSGR